MKDFLLISGVFFSLLAIFSFGYCYVIGLHSFYKKDDEKDDVEELRFRSMFDLFLISCLGITVSVILSVLL